MSEVDNGKKPCPYCNKPLGKTQLYKHKSLRTCAPSTTQTTQSASTSTITPPLPPTTTPNPPAPSTASNVVTSFEVSEHINRPENPFVLYRKAVSAIVKSFIPDRKDLQVIQKDHLYMKYRDTKKSKYYTELTGLISMLAGKAWGTESESVKRNMYCIAGRRKIEHMQRYPGYKYKPRKKGKGKATSSFTPSPLLLFTPGSSTRTHAPSPRPSPETGSTVASHEQGNIYVDKSYELLVQTESSYTQNNTPGYAIPSTKPPDHDQLIHSTAGLQGWSTIAPNLMPPSVHPRPTLPAGRIFNDTTSYYAQGSSYERADQEAPVDGVHQTLQDGPQQDWQGHPAYYHETHATASSSDQSAILRHPKGSHPAPLLPHDSTPALGLLNEISDYLTGQQDYAPIHTAHSALQIIPDTYSLVNGPVGDDTPATNSANGALPPWLAAFEASPSEIANILSSIDFVPMHDPQTAPASTSSQMSRPQLNLQTSLTHLPYQNSEPSSTISTPLVQTPSPHADAGLHQRHDVRTAPSPAYFGLGKRDREDDGPCVDDQSKRQRWNASEYVFGHGNFGSSF